MAQELAERARPAQALRAEDGVGGLMLGGGIVRVQVFEGDLAAPRPVPSVAGDARGRRCAGRRAEARVLPFLCVARMARGRRHAGPRAGACALPILFGPCAHPLLLGLRAHQPEVGAARAHQRGVVAGLHDRSVVEHQDAFRPDHARQPVREDEGGAPLHQPVQRLLDHRLVLRVHRGQGLVEDQDRRVAQQRAGDRDALALPSGELDAPLAHHRGVALRQPGDELVGVRGPRRRLDLLLARIGLAEAQVVLDRAVEEVRVLVHHRDAAVDVLGAKPAQIVPADAHHAFAGIVEAQQQPHDGGLPGPALPHEPHPLPGADAEREPPVRGPPSAGVGEGHVLERHRGRERAVERDRRGRGLDLRTGIEHREDVVRRRRSQHPGVQQRAQIALGAEHLDAHHQDHEQHVEAHLALGDPPCPVPEHRRAPHRDAGVGEAAGQGVGGEHPHRAPEHLVRALRQQPAARGALPERLEGGEPLHRVEELGRESAVRLRPARAAAGVPALEEPRREQGEHRESEHQRGDREVEEREPREDHERGDGRHQELREVFAEPGLELLDPVDHREQHRAGALQPEVGGAEGHHLGVEPLAQRELHPRRGTVREHGAGMLDPPAQHHDRRHQREGHHQLGEGISGEDPRQQPAEQCEPPDADQGGEHPHRHRGRDAKAHAARELPEPVVEEHAGARWGRCRPVMGGGIGRSSSGSGAGQGQGRRTGPAAQAPPLQTCARLPWCPRLSWRTPDPATRPMSDPARVSSALAMPRSALA